MAKLINQDEAIRYRQSIADPIVRGMVTHGHRLAILHGDSLNLDRDFDVLFLTKLHELFFQDKARLSKELAGEFEEPEFGI